MVGSGFVRALLDFVGLHNLDAQRLPRSTNVRNPLDGEN